MSLGEIPLHVVYEGVPDNQVGTSFASKDAAYANVGPNLAFPRDLLIIETELGRGAFGRVLLGTALGIKDSAKPTKVAVKTLKGRVTWAFCQCKMILQKCP